MAVPQERGELDERVSVEVLSRCGDDASPPKPRDPCLADPNNLHQHSQPVFNLVPHSYHLITPSPSTMRELTSAPQAMVQPSPRTRQYVADFADSDALFPWKDMPFMIVKTVNSELKKLLGMRITVRSDLECS
jgi:hypothetical protein